jgi:hypothetical protein
MDEPLLTRPLRKTLRRLALIVDLVGFFLPLSFSPGSCARDEDFIVPLTINKDDPRLGS